MQTTRPRITWKVLPMAQVAIFKDIRSSAKRFRLWIVYSELKRHNVSHYIYYLATDNIHIVLENDNTVLIKGLKKVDIKFSRNTRLIETSYDRLKSREITFQYRKILLKQVFRWVTNIHEHKRYYYTFDNSLLFSGIRDCHRLHAKSQRPVSSVSAPGRWHILIRVRAKPCVHRLIIPGHSRREVPRQGCGHS